MTGMAFAVTGRLWLNPDNGLAENPPDEAFLEWMLAHGARVVTRGSDPFFSLSQNYPDGVNMMANTSVLGISLPLAPLTLLLGPHIAFVIFLTGALAATGVCWFAVMSRGFRLSPQSSAVGAGFIAYAPSAVSHAQGHPNIVAQFLVPLLILATFRLCRPGRWVRGGVRLAALVVWQAFINLEVLLLTATGLALFCAAMMVRCPTLRRSAATFARGLGVAALVVGVVLAYPLHLLFRGPQSYQGLPSHIRAMGTDPGAFVALGRQSLGGDPVSAAGLAQNAAEENTFLGWGLVLLAAAIVVWLRRRPQVIALAWVAGVAAVLSLGTRIAGTGIPTPWAGLQQVPILESVVPTRWGMLLAPVIGILLAVACQRVWTARATADPHLREPITVALTTILAMALIPLTPTALPTAPKDPTPGFISAGLWRDYLGEDRSLVTLPLPDNRYPDPIRWSASAGPSLRIARGYFLGPSEESGTGPASFSAPTRPTDVYFARLRYGGPPALFTSELGRADLLDDLRYWRAGVIVVARQPNDGLLRDAMTRLLSRDAVWVAGVWIWDVRDLTDSKE
ncbi:hypothetical protein DMB66_51285 [Actinoplanes sp. ATCC 53533]|nr:hypothetical protein DMB66_51285 [Actinoplanes sp. ATCC 53533]